MWCPAILPRIYRVRHHVTVQWESEEVMLGSVGGISTRHIWIHVSFGESFVPLTADAPSFRPIERFTCVLYERSSKCVEVNALRKDLFPRKVQHMTGLPPTQAALLEHVNRSLFQSSIWLQSFQARQNVPSADAFGWRKRDTLWELVWTPLAEAATG